MLVKMTQITLIFLYVNNNEMKKIDKNEDYKERERIKNKFLIFLKNIFGL